MRMNLFWALLFPELCLHISFSFVQVPFLLASIGLIHQILFACWDGGSGTSIYIYHSIIYEIRVEVDLENWLWDSLGLRCWRRKCLHVHHGWRCPCQKDSTGRRITVELQFNSIQSESTPSCWSQTSLAERRKLVARVLSWGVIWEMIHLSSSECGGGIPWINAGCQFHTFVVLIIYL